MAEEEQRPDDRPEPEDEGRPEAPEGEPAAAGPDDAASEPSGGAGGDGEAPPDEAPSDDAGAEAPSEDAGAEEEEPAAPAAEKKSDLPPGAELEPIAIEPERELTAEERARVEAEAEERARAEAAATAESGEEPVPAREPAVELPTDARIQATGKRKSSIARVILRSGTGGFEINDRALQEYFPRHQHQTLVRQPLLTSGYEGKVDIRVRVHGGGVTGQAGAVRHGIARALTEIEPDLRGELKRRGLLTRDARAKERRKAGLKKARKRPQFSKR